MSDTIDTCGCCEGIQQVTPTTIANRPGLSALAYRTGIYVTFLETMLARLSNMSIPLGELDTILDDPNKANDPRFPLRGITTRTLDDPSIAMLDAWAVVADVLTFYQERIANEGYLRTATERRSILELARLIGYKLRPGVAASVFLAYTLEDGQRTTVPQGSRVQSLPGPGQMPQAFETSFDIEARAEWNAIKPRMSVPQYINQIIDPSTKQISAQSLYINTHDGALYLQGTSTNLKPGDPLLLVFNDQDLGQVLGHAQQIDPHQAEKYTRVVFPPDFMPYTFFRSLENLLALYQDTDAFGLTASDLLVQSIVLALQAVIDDLQKVEDAGIPSFSDNELVLGSVVSFLRFLCIVYDQAVQSGSQSSLRGISFQFPILVMLMARLGIQGINGFIAQLDAIIDAGHTPRARLAAWVGGIVNDVKAIINTVPECRFSIQRVCSPVVTTSIAALVSPLAKAPSLQPANSIRLQRNTKDAFSRKSDLAPRILQTLNQAVAPNVYAALSSANVTASPSLQYVYALRVKATPFGSNAPLKPVYDDQGHFLNRYEEWPLLSSFPFVFQIPDFQLTDRNLTITVLLQQGAQPAVPPQTVSFTLPQEVGDGPTTFDQTVSFSAVPAAPSITITVAIDKDSGDIISITLTINNYTIVLTPKPASTTDKHVTSWDVSVTGKIQNVTVGQTQTLANNTTIRYEQVSNVKRMSVFYTAIDILGVSDLYTLDLDAQYDKIVPDSWIVIEYANNTPPLMSKVLQVQSLSRADYSMSSKITRLVLEKPWLTGHEQSLSEIRGITIYAQGEKLVLAEEPLTEDIQGSAIELDDLYDSLQSGRWVVVSGERADIANTSGVRTSELMLLESVTQQVRVINHIPPPGPPTVNGITGPTSDTKQAIDLPGDKIHTFLHFAKPLSFTYKRDTVTVGANVVKATHGETKNEVLGSGDGTTGIQQFTLKQSPVTYVAAATGTGAASTLHVYVNDIEWHEVDNLDGQGPKDRVFVTQTDDQDKTTVLFGDGIHGARLPTGAENVRATYRIRLGKEGNVDAEQITLLATRPLGVKGVINPQSATGGADHESRDSARANAPVAVHALERVVSVQDYADFARAFAGIAKASVRLLPAGRQQMVHLTIAGQDNVPIDPTSDLYRSLFQALRTLGNPSEPLRLDVCEVKLLVISMRIRLLPDYQLEKVVPNVRAALLSAFGFEQRHLGQPVYQSEVLSVIQQVPGVAFVDLDILDAVNQPKLLQALDAIHLAELQEAASGKKQNETQDLIDLLGLRVRQVVQARLAQAVPNRPGSFTPAQLAFLTPDIADTLIINELTSPIEPVKHTSMKLQKLRSGSSSIMRGI